MSPAIIKRAPFHPRRWEELEPGEAGEFREIAGPVLDGLEDRAVRLEGLGVADLFDLLEEAGVTLVQSERAARARLLSLLKCRALMLMSEESARRIASLGFASGVR